MLPYKDVPKEGPPSLRHHLSDDGCRWDLGDDCQNAVLIHSSGQTALSYIKIPLALTFPSVNL